MWSTKQMRINGHLLRSRCSTYNPLVFQMNHDRIYKDVQETQGPQCSGVFYIDVQAVWSAGCYFGRVYGCHKWSDHDILHIEPLNSILTHHCRYDHNNKLGGTSFKDRQMVWLKNPIVVDFSKWTTKSFGPSHSMKDALTTCFQEYDLLMVTKLKAKTRMLILSCL